MHNKGLRILGGGMRLELPWPELADYPSYGLVRPRTDFDDLLARQAVKAGATLRERDQRHRHRSSTSAPVTSPASPRAPRTARSPTARPWSSPLTATPAGSRSRWA